MLTPIDISNMEFTKSAFGYNKNEVEEFVSAVASEYERLYKENIEYKDKINIMNEALKNYKATEDALKNTLMFAQNTAEDVKKNAKEKAEITIAEAKAQAERMVIEADGKVFEAERKLKEIKSQISSYKAQLEGIIETQRKLLEGIEW